MAVSIPKKLGIGALALLGAFLPEVKDKIAELYAGVFRLTQAR